MSDKDAREEDLKLFDDWRRTLPHCVGDAGACDGNLVGLEHEDNCPMKGKEPTTYFDTFRAGILAAESQRTQAPSGSRERFEEFARTKMLDGVARDAEGQYINFDVRFAWNVWQNAVAGTQAQAAQKGVDNAD